MQIFRLLYINIVLLQHGLDQFVWNTRLFRPLNFLIIFFPWRWFQKSKPPTGEAIRLALESLGPIFVQFGQMLSTRQDLLPYDVAMELAKLQDNVPSFDGQLAQSIIETSLGEPIDKLFAKFDTTPIASASIAQVHAATLHDGREIIIKVLRPKIQQHIKRDIILLESFAKILQHVPMFKRFKPIAVVQEIKQTLYNETDLLREAASASSLKRNFAGSHLISVPEIHWDYCRKNILVQERVSGTRISDIESLKSQNVNLKVLAERGVEIFFTQVFRDCFFHADMHPGNIFVDASKPESPRYIAVDFGIMGTLNPMDQRYLAENFIAFFKRDYRRVARLHIESGWVPLNTSLANFEAAIRTVSEPIFEKPLKDISFAQTLLRLFQVARQFNMEVQPQLLLLQKTLLNVEGLGRQLYPDLDLWVTAKPFLENWIKTQFGPKALFKEVKQKLPRWANEFIEIPGAVHDIMHNLQSYTQSVAHQNTDANHPSKSISFARITRLALGCTLLIVATLIGLNTLPQSTLQHWGLTATILTVGLGGFCLLSKKN